MAQAINSLLAAPGGVRLHLLAPAARCLAAENDDFQLNHLLEKLTGYEPEKVYERIQRDLEDKYRLAAAHFHKLEECRQRLIATGTLSADKEERRKTVLRDRLDEVVDTLRTDFGDYVRTHAALLDELFLWRTNEHYSGDLAVFTRKVMDYLRLAEDVYSEEFRKMERIYELLDEEGLRLKNHVDLT